MGKAKKMPETRDPLQDARRCVFGEYVFPLPGQLAIRVRFEKRIDESGTGMEDALTDCGLNEARHERMLLAAITDSIQGVGFQ